MKLLDQKKSVASVVISAVILLTAGGFWLHQKNTGPIPLSIKKQINFVIYYPGGDSSGISVDKKSLKYDSKLGVFSYKFTQAAQTITVSEQSTPQNFIDIPDEFNKLIDSLHEYYAFSNYYGSVYLTHPEELKGQQSAIMNSAGTLLIAHPGTIAGLSEDQWKSFFNSITVIR